MRRKLDSRLPMTTGGRCLGLGGRLIIVAALAILVLATLAGCSKSTKPKEVSYNVYIGGGNRIYIYDADSLILLDSISREYGAKALAASPDGLSLYVLDGPENNPYGRISKVDIQTKQVVWSRSTDGVGGMTGIRLLANGALVLIGNGALRAEDGVMVQRFGDSLVAMYGPVNGNKVAVVRNADVWVADATTGEISGRFIAKSDSLFFPVEYARLHPDGKRVLVIAGASFMIGDVTTGEKLFQYGLDQPLGEIGISEDGSLAVVTDPPGMWGTYPMLNLIDLDHPALIWGIHNELARLTQVRFLPDNVHVVLAPSSLSYDSGQLRILDIRQMTYLTTALPSDYRPFNGGMDIGPRQ